MHAARIVKLPWKTEHVEDARQRGKEIAQFLKDMGLRMGGDFTWLIRNEDREIHILFNGVHAEWETMVTMKYI